MDYLQAGTRLLEFIVSGRDQRELQWSIQSLENSKSEMMHLVAKATILEFASLHLANLVENYSNNNLYKSI